jgi:general secretion pathway protein I
VSNHHVSNRRGFTLLELIVATTILAVAVVGLMAGITGSTRNAARLRDSDRVAMAARERMNELLANYTLQPNIPLAGLFDPEFMGGIEAGWQAQLTTAEKPTTAAGQLALDRIRLQVWWNRNGNRRTLDLESFRKRFATAADLQSGGPK